MVIQMYMDTYSLTKILDEMHLNPIKCAFA
jgi:hypothetical protein